MDFDNKLLIMLVQEFDCLHNPECDTYRNREVREGAWESIYKSILGESWEDLSLKERSTFGKRVQRRWKCLKDAYSRSLKARSEKRVGGGKTGRPYIYEQDMAFLNQSIKSSPFAEAHHIEEEVDLSDTEEIIVNVDPCKADRPSRNSNRIAKNSTDPPIKRQRTQQPVHSHEIAPSSLTLQPYTAPPLQYNEEDKMFLLSLLPSMQDMSAVEKIDFKINVMSLLKESMESRERKRLSKYKVVDFITIPAEQEGEVQVEDG